MAELDPDQEAALRRLRAAFGFIQVLRIVDHREGQGQDEGEPLDEDEQAPLAVDPSPGNHGCRRIVGAMGAHYRHTTPEMAAPIAAAIEQRLTMVLEVAEQTLEAQPNRSPQRVL